MQNLRDVDDGHQLQINVADPEQPHQVEPPGHYDPQRATGLQVKDARTQLLYALQAAHDSMITISFPCDCLYNSQYYHFCLCWSCCCWISLRSLSTSLSFLYYFQ